MIRVLVIAGPTASGKTALAVALARRLGGEIVNADSQQVYRGLDVGTAKPTATERAAAPHHLLDVVERQCPSCGRMMHVCDHRYRRFHTLQGPVELLCRLNHCPDPDCPGHARIKSPKLEVAIALPKWAIGWDVLCWIGHRRCSRH